MGARRRVLPEAFKREAVERVTFSGLSISQVAQELVAARDGSAAVGERSRPQATGPARRLVPQAAAPMFGLNTPQSVGDLKVWGRSLAWIPAVRAGSHPQRNKLRWGKG